MVSRFRPSSLSHCLRAFWPLKLQRGHLNWSRYPEDGGRTSPPPVLMPVIGIRKQGDQAKALALFALALSASLVIGTLLESGVLHLLHNSLRKTFTIFLPLPAAATASTIIIALRSRSHVTIADHTNPPYHSNKQVRQPLLSLAGDLQRSSFWIAFHMLMYQPPFVALVLIRWASCSLH